MAGVVHEAAKVEPAWTRRGGLVDDEDAADEVADTRGIGGDDGRWGAGDDGGGGKAASVGVDDARGRVGGGTSLEVDVDVDVDVDVGAWLGGGGGGDGGDGGDGGAVGSAGSSGKSWCGSSGIG